MRRAMQERDREGVALILVIGMLALMMVMGVSFAIFMRTERVAAGNYRNDVQARQLLNVALARAMAAVEAHAALTNAHYPEWLMLVSTNAAGTTVTNAAWATNYIPWGAVDANLDAVKWIDVGGGGQGWDGRIAYACINASGLLDINHAGFTTRGSGTNASEIQIDVLPDVKNAATLVNNRPYDSIQEVNSLAAAGLQGPASSFIPYAASPKSYPGGATEPWVDIGGDEAALQAKRADIVAAFQSSGATAADAEFLYTNLLDYVDADHVPRDLASPCTESVPMINEVYVSIPYTFMPDGRLGIVPTIAFEWFYPFVKPNPTTYWLKYEVTFQKVGGVPTDDILPAPNPLVGSVALSYAGGTCQQAAVSPAPGTITPKIGTYTNSFGQALRLSASVRMEIHEGSAAGPLVDAAPYPVAGTPLLIMNAPTNIPSGKVAAVTTIPVGLGAEVMDPRFNWNCDYLNGNQWKPYIVAASNTINKANNVALAKLSGRVADADTRLYVADEPLRSPWELSYLARGVAQSSTPPIQWHWWRTLRLMDESSGGISATADPVLDYFVVGLTNGVRRGCANPNTRSVDVLKAMLIDMPLNKYPLEPGAYTLTDADATRLATWWVSAGNSVGGSISNLSRMGQMTNVFADAVFTGRTAFEKEAFFRNLVNLLDVRQNYFVILLYAQSTKTTPDGVKNVAAECRGVAEVWRDARPNAEGKHPCKVRLLKVLPNP